MEALNAVVARVKQCMFGACDAAAALLVGAAVPIRTPPLCTHHGRTSVSQSRATRNSAAAARDRRRSVAAAAPMGQPPQKSGDCSECRRQYRPQHLRQPLLPLQVPLLLLAAETASRCAQQRVGRAVHPPMPPPLPPFAAVDTTHSASPVITGAFDTLKLCRLPVL